MKNAESIDNAKKSSPKKDRQNSVNSMQQQIDLYKKEKDVLLALSNDITRVRDKNDLIILFSKLIKSLYHFTHTIVTLVDYKDETYTPFLLDNEASPIRNHNRYQEMVQAHFSLNEPFIQAVLKADEPISFVLKDIMDKPQSPPFLRVNYEKGAKEFLPFPLQGTFMSSLKNAALQQQKLNMILFWSGQIAPLLHHTKASALMHSLIEETTKIVSTNHQ